MKLLRTFPALAFALVLLGIAGFCAAQESVQLLLVAGTLAAMSWYITEGPRGKTLPRWVSNILVIGVCLNVCVDVFQNRQDLLGVLGRSVVWLTLIKLYERRTARDYAHLLTLSLLLMMTGCLKSNGFLFGVLLVVYAGLGLYVLLLYQLYAWYERSRNARQSAIPADYRLVGPLKPIAGRLAGLHFRTQTVSIGIVGAAVSVLAFLVFPRGVGAGMLGALHVPSSDRMPQFSWQVDLNVGGRISQSRRKVMSLQLSDGRGRVVSTREPLRLRGAVLDRYEGQGRWRAPQGRLRRMGVAPPTAAVLEDVHDAGQILTQRFDLVRMSSGSAPLFSVYAPVSVETDKAARLDYDSARQVIKTVEGSPRLMSYTVYAQRNGEEGVGTIERGAWSPQPPWFVAADQDTLRGIAETVLAQAGVEGDRETWQWRRDAASALTRYLQTTGGFTYTTDLSMVKRRDLSEDPIILFLTHSKRGHCEFFASGLAALCQSVGIRARLAVGYVAYEHEPGLGWYNVVESNAHAWVEVQTGPRYWATFDPTPAATLREMHASQSTVADRLRWAYQTFEGDWSDTIAGFDDTAQTEIVETINQGWFSKIRSAWDSVRAWMERVNQRFYYGPAGYIWMGIVGLALVIAIVALVKLMRRSMAIKSTLQLQHLRGREYQRMLRQLGFYLDMLGVLKRNGMAKPHWQPPLEFARLELVGQARAAELVREITGVFYEARYGRKKLERDEVERARQMVEELSGVVARS